MKLHTDDIRASFCIYCKKFLGEEENCGKIADGNFENHPMVKANLTSVLNYAVKLK